jgi:tetrahydromethanopterin S-methyltransferase subunit G
VILKRGEEIGEFFNLMLGILHGLLNGLVLCSVMTHWQKEIELIAVKSAVEGKVMLKEVGRNMVVKSAGIKLKDGVEVELRADDSASLRKAVAGTNVLECADGRLENRNKNGVPMCEGKVLWCQNVMFWVFQSQTVGSLDAVVVRRLGLGSGGVSCGDLFRMPEAIIFYWSLAAVRRVEKDSFKNFLRDNKILRGAGDVDGKSTGEILAAGQRVEKGRMKDLLFNMKFFQKAEEVERESRKDLMIDDKVFREIENVIQQLAENLDRDIGERRACFAIGHLEILNGVLKRLVAIDRVSTAGGVTDLYAKVLGMAGSTGWQSLAAWICWANFSGRI